MRPDPMTAGTAGPDGQEMTVRKRIAEILGRYGPDHVVSRALARSAPELIAAVERVQHELAACAAMRRPSAPLALAVA